MYPIVPPRKGHRGFVTHIFLASRPAMMYNRNVVYIEYDSRIGGFA